MPKRLEAMHLARRLALLLCCAVLALLAIPALAQQELTPEDVREMEKEYLFDVACGRLRELSADGTQPITKEQFHEAVAPLVEEGSIAEGAGLYFAGIRALYLGIPEAGIPYLTRALDEYASEIIFEARNQTISDITPFWLARLQRGAGHLEAAIETYKSLLGRKGHLPPICRLLIAEVLSDSLNRRNEALLILEEVCALQSEWASDTPAVEHGPFGDATREDIDAVYCQWARCEQARLRGAREAQYYSAEGQAGAYMAFYKYLDLTGLMGYTTGCRGDSPDTRWISLSRISKFDVPSYLVTFPFKNLYDMKGISAILELDFERDSIFRPIVGFKLWGLLRHQGKVDAAEALNQRLRQALPHFF